MWPACEIIYLHVIDHNISAIKFYERNCFQILKTIKNHYNIKGLPYNAIIMYKDVSSRQAERDPTKIPAEIQQWSYYDYARFPLEYLKEY